MIRANFTENGLDIGQDRVDMTYLYGLSDFFSVMFEDTSVLNLMLEAQTHTAGDIYSKFLHLASTISLETIQETIGSSVEFITISDLDAVPGEVNCYKLPANIHSSQYVANRPFLPTALLENNIDFRITQNSDGTSTIKFAASIDSYTFSKRISQDGKTNQYALWLVDVQLDERLMAEYFGKLIGVTPDNSSERFSNFVYGLFYVYTQGPTLDLLRKGLNLSLGVPLARAIETVLDVRKYNDTDQYIVITDQNQYLIPFGLEPTVEVGETLTIGLELAKSVEIKDYISDDEWWVNLHIPPSVVPNLPEGQSDRYATRGSQLDFIMRHYVKKHTFLVKVNVREFKNNQKYAQLSDIIHRAKPTYTSPIYVWAVTADNENFGLDDERGFEVTPAIHKAEFHQAPIEAFYRNNHINPLNRSAGYFIRFNAPASINKILGHDPYTDGEPFKFGGIEVEQTINSIAVYRENTPSETGWIHAVSPRGSDTRFVSRSSLIFARGASNHPRIEEGIAVPMSGLWDNLPYEGRVIPLYTTTLKDMNRKLSFLGESAPDAWAFNIFHPDGGLVTDDINASPINTRPINESVPKGYNRNRLRATYHTFQTRGEDINYFSISDVECSYDQYDWKEEDIQPYDFLKCIRIEEDVIGVYWVTSNMSLIAPDYWGIEIPDPMKITYTAPMNRGSGINGSSLYTTRGAVTYNIQGDPFNDTAINEGAINQYSTNNSTFAEVSETAEPRIFKDVYNPNGVQIDRSGNATIVHAVESY